MLVGGHEPFEKLGEGQRASSQYNALRSTPKALDELSAVLLDLLGVTVDSEGPLYRTARDRVKLNLEAVGLPAGEDIDLDTYLTAVETLAPVRAGRFTQMVDFLRRAKTSAGQPAAGT